MAIGSPVYGALPQNIDTAKQLNCDGEPLPQCVLNPYYYLSTFETLKRVGIEVTMNAQQVDLDIGLAIMWIAEDSIRQWKKPNTCLSEMQRRQRAFNRVLTILKRSSKIPEVGIIRTTEVCVSINTLTAAHEGIIITGPMVNTQLHHMTSKQLAIFKRSYAEPDTQEIIDAWESLIRCSG